MSTFTNSKKRFAASLAVVALISVGLTSIPVAANAAPVCATVGKVTSCGGATTDGAKYAIQVPSNFNGTLFLYSHGYRYVMDIPGYSTAAVLANPIPGPTSSDYSDMTTIGTLLEEGYAVAGSTFPVLGWNTKEAIKTNVELIGVVKKKFTKTKKVIAWGESLGGYITQALAEKYPKLIDASGLMCPALGNVAAELATAGDFLWGLKTIFEPKLKGHAYSAGVPGMVEAGTDLALLKGLADKLKVSIATELATSKPSWPAGTPGATYLAAVPVRSVLLYLGLMAGIPTRSAHFDGVSGPGAEGSTTAFGFAAVGSPALAVLENGFNAAGLAVLGTYDVEKQSGGAFFDNTKTDYAKRVAVEKSVWNIALSGSAAITGIQTVLGTAAIAPRWAADPLGAYNFAKQIKHTGKLSHPTVTLTATEDAIVPEGNTQWLINKQKTAADKAKLLVLWNAPADAYTTFDATGTPVSSTPEANGTGHCNFTADQYLAVAHMLADAVESGGKLDTGAFRKYVVAVTDGISIEPRKGRMQKFYDK
jgi:pimeloyl-ACP methyl ester carboxylesterase